MVNITVNGLLNGNITLRESWFGVCGRGHGNLCVLYNVILYNSNNLLVCRSWKKTIHSNRESINWNWNWKLLWFFCVHTHHSDLIILAKCQICLPCQLIIYLIAKAEHFFERNEINRHIKVSFSFVDFELWIWSRILHNTKKDGE